MSVEAKIRRLEALASSTTFAGERANALAAIERLRAYSTMVTPATPLLSEDQARDKAAAISALGASLIGEHHGEELYWVPGQDAVTERELFELWLDWQAGAGW